MSEVVLDLDRIDESHLREAIDQAFADDGIRSGFDALLARNHPFYLGRTLEAGGCLILAQALRQLFGGELVGVDARNDAGSRSLEHVVLRPWTDRETLLDQRGFWDDEEHLLNWLADDAEFDRPGIEPIDPGALPGSLLYDQGLVELLAERLREALTATR